MEMNMENLQQRLNDDEVIEFETPTIVLASASPRRAKMLEKYGVRFVRILSSFDDIELNNQFPHEGVTKKQESHYAKSMALAKLQPFVDKIKTCYLCLFW